MAAEREDRKESFTVSTPGCSLRADLPHIRASPSPAMVLVTAQMREGYVLQIPEKLDADAFPRPLVLDAQLVGSLYRVGTFETDVLAVSLEKIEENHLAQTVGGRAVGHA
jgi:hypothetical protein